MNSKIASVLKCLVICSLMVLYFFLLKDRFSTPQEEVSQTLSITEEAPTEIPTPIPTLTPTTTPTPTPIVVEEEVEEVKIESLSIDTPKYDITKEEEKLLLDLVFCEANVESIECQMAVIQVVLNRVEDDEFPDTIEEVIYQHKGKTYQFSPVGSGAIEKATPTETNKDALERVLNGECTLPSNILYFWATSVNVQKKGTWFYKMHQNNFFKQIDKTYFYSG